MSPSHYLNQYCIIVNWNLRNKRKLNCSRNSNIFFHTKAIENSVCKISSILSVSLCHYNDVIMGMMASQITSLTIVYSIDYSGVDQRKHQSSVSLAFVRGIHRWPVNSTHKWSATRKKFPFDDIIILSRGWRRGALWYIPRTFSFKMTRNHSDYGLSQWKTQLHCNWSFIG